MITAASPKTTSFIVRRFHFLFLFLFFTFIFLRSEIQSYVASQLTEHYHPERAVAARTTNGVAGAEHSCIRRIVIVTATKEPRATRTDEVGVIWIPSARLT